MVAMENLDPRLNDARIELEEDFCSILVRDDAHTTHIGTLLMPTDNTMVNQTLIENVDLFSYTSFDMPRLNPDIITYRLSVYKKARPPRRKGR